MYVLRCVGVPSDKRGEQDGEISVQLSLARSLARSPQSSKRQREARVLCLRLEAGSIRTKNSPETGKKRENLEFLLNWDPHQWRTPLCAHNICFERTAVVFLPHLGFHFGEEVTVPFRRAPIKDLWTLAATV